MSSLIFDLDQTLIDSRLASLPRQNREWGKVYDLIPRFSLYEGMQKLFKYIVDNEIKVCIVTMSPQSYCLKVLSYWEIPYNYTVCYHDVINRKPHPEPILKAVSLLEEPSKNVLSFGDRAVDIQASKAANVKSVACLWGAENQQEILSAKPDVVVEDVSQVIDLVKLIQSS